MATASDSVKMFQRLQKSAYVAQRTVNKTMSTVKKLQKLLRMRVEVRVSTKSTMTALGQVKRKLPELNRLSIIRLNVKDRDAMDKMKALMQSALTLHLQAQMASTSVAAVKPGAAEASKSSSGSSSSGKSAPSSMLGAFNLVSSANSIGKWLSGDGAANIAGAAFKLLNKIPAVAGVVTKLTGPLTTFGSKFKAIFASIGGTVPTRGGGPPDPGGGPPPPSPPPGPPPPPPPPPPPSGTRMQNLLSGAKGLLAKVNFGKVIEIADQALQGAAEEGKLKQMFIARSGGDVGMGTAMFDKFRAQAVDNSVDVSEFLKGTLDAFGRTKNSNDLASLNDLAVQSSAFDISGGGYAKSMKAVMAAFNGNLSDLAGQLQIPVDEFKALNIDKLGKSGDVNGFAKAIREVMGKNGMGEESVKAASASPLQKLEDMKTKLDAMLTGSALKAIDLFAPAIDKVVALFEKPEVGAFFALLEQGFAMLASVAGAVVTWITERWNAFMSVLAVVSAVLAILAAIWFVEWLIAAAPILIIIAVIFGLIELLNFLGVQAEDVVGYLIGCFFSLWASIQNGVAVVWNIFVALAEFFANFLTDPVYAVQKLFWDVFRSIGEYVTNTINSTIKGVNWLIEQGKKLGINIPVVPELNFSELEEASKPVSEERVKDFSNLRMKQQNKFDAFNEGMQLGKSWFKAKPPGSDLSEHDKNEKARKIDEIGSVNSINQPVKLDNDSIDISSEDLQMLHELATVKSVQNFVTLTPTVQVTTGDIHKETDVNEMIRRIEKYLEEQFAATAGGVYG